MIRNLRDWLQHLFNIGVPAIFSISMLLPGTPGDDNKPSVDTPLPEAIGRELTKAKILLDLGHSDDAKSVLIRADDLISQLTPHTTDHERLVVEKTGLWEILGSIGQKK